MESFKFQKKWGQNFLIDNNILDKIEEASSLNNKVVIEIGPGNGALTNRILNKAKKVITIEIDPKLTSELNSKFKEYDNFILINEDVKKINFNKLKEKYLINEEKFVLISNLPYNITSDILFKLYEESNIFEFAILMLQKEVIDKLLAKPRDKKYSSTTVIIQTIADLKEICFVKKTSFFPVPNVDSKVIKINFSKKNINFLNKTKYLEFIKKAFISRRKSLVNNLKSIILKQDIIKTLKEINKNELVRPEELNNFEFLVMYFSLIENFSLSKCNAKLTLALSIGKKNDNYHEVYGIYLPFFRLFDYLLIKKTKSSFDRINYYPNQIDNSTIHQLFKKINKVNNYDCLIIKNIPIGAGLSGGSSDLFFTYKYICEQENNNINKYLNIIKAISIDSLFFQVNSICKVSNIGDKFDLIKTNLKLPIKLKFHKIVAITEKVYQEFDKLYDSPKLKIKEINSIIKNIEANNLSVIKQEIFNDLYLPYKSFYNLNKDLKEGEYLTGSGSTTFSFI